MNVSHLLLDFQLTSALPKHGGIFAGLQCTSLFKSQIGPVLELLGQQCYSEFNINLSRDWSVDVSN